MTQNNFETFNIEQDNDKSDENLAISKEERRLLNKKEAHDSDSSLDINDRDLKESHETLKHIYQNNKSKFKYSKDFNMINNFRNGVYINELGEESILSDSSTENNKEKLNETEKANEIFKNKIVYSKITNKIAKAYVPQIKHKKSRAKKTGLLDCYYKRISKNSLLNILENENKVNSNSFDVQLVPKIKFNSQKCKTKNTNVRGSYHPHLRNIENKY